MQGNAKTHWIWVVVVGAVYFVLYYIIFRFMISKFDYKHPGPRRCGGSQAVHPCGRERRSAASGQPPPPQGMTRSAP